MSACHGRSEASERVGFLRCDRNLDMVTTRRGKQYGLDKGPVKCKIHSAYRNGGAEEDREKKKETRERERGECQGEDKDEV